MSVINAVCSSVNGGIDGMNSSVVPGWSRHTPASATISSRLAARDGTGLPSPSLCVIEVLDEKPRPPAASDSPSTRRIVSTWAGVASLPTASSCITVQRIAE